MPEDTTSSAAPHPQLPSLLSALWDEEGAPEGARLLFGQRRVGE